MEILVFPFSLSKFEVHESRIQKIEKRFPIGKFETISKKTRYLKTMCNYVFFLVFTETENIYVFRRYTFLNFFSFYRITWQIYMYLFCERGFRNVFAGLLSIYLKERERERERGRWMERQFHRFHCGGWFTSASLWAQGERGEWWWRRPRLTSIRPGIFFPPTSGSFDQETMNWWHSPGDAIGHAH